MPEKSIRLIIKSVYNSLSLKEQFIADYILENPKHVARSSISEIAGKLQVADSTLFQFTRKLGFNGFKDFKVALLMESPKQPAASIHENITKNDSALMMARKVFDSNIQTLSDTKNLLVEKDLTKAVGFLVNAQTVLFAGIGGSEIIAADAYHKFMRSPINCRHTTDYHLQLMHAALLQENDCAVIISHTGASKETIQIAQVAKKNHALLVVITSHPNSELAKLGDVVFLSLSDETSYRSEALSSRITQLSIIDALYVISMFQDETKSSASLDKVRQVIKSIKK